MSLVDVKVELGINFSGPSAGVFLLDSSSFGVLGVSKLSDLQFYDLTQYVTGVSTTRGRSRQLDYFNAGSATVTFNNRGREFDPLNESSPFYGGIQPRGYLRITAKTFPVFYGYINDWDLSYDISNNDVATVYCSDGFSILANQALTAFTTSSQFSGARINAILARSEVNYIGGREIAAGKNDLGPDDVSAGTNVLNYLRQVERSEQGELFISREGDLIFRDRLYSPTSSPVDFSDDGLSIPYQTLSNQYGDETLYNYIRLKNFAGTVATQSNSDSIGLYQVSQLAYEDLLNSSSGVLTIIAQSLLNRFKDAQVRLTGFRIQLKGLIDEEQNKVLNLELADYVSVKKSFAVGSPSSITQVSLVSGISHNISPDNHSVSFSIEPAVGTFYVVLGAEVAGRLDLGLLDF
jgi:hypothetical protein